jgi:hypothetical protein
MLPTTRPLPHLKCSLASRQKIPGFSRVEVDFGLSSHGGTIGEIGSILSRTRANARAAGGGGEAILDRIDRIAKMPPMR